MIPANMPGPGKESLKGLGTRAKVCLLIVDDEPALREISSRVLTDKGYDVLTAEDGFDALRLLSEPLPDGPAPLPDLADRIRVLGPHWETLAQDADAPSREVTTR